MKINFTITAFLLFNITVFSQEKDFENYNQKIAGNDYGLEMISINGGVFSWSPTPYLYQYRKIANSNLLKKKWINCSCFRY